MKRQPLARTAPPARGHGGPAPRRQVGGAIRRGALALVTVMLAACAGAAAGGDDAPVRVGFVQAHMTSTFRTQMIEGAEETAEEFGVDLEVFNSNNEVPDQNEAIINYAGQGFDVIVVAAIELESVLPAVRNAADQGVQVIAVDTVIDDEAVSAQVGVDNAEGGRTMGEFVASYAEEQGLEPRVGVVGALNSEIQNTRMDSFSEVLEEAGGTIVQTVDGQNRQEVAIASAENLLTAQDGLPIVYATGEPALVGLLGAVRSQGLEDSVKVAGWDLSQESIQGIDDGLVIGIAHQPAHEEGVAAIETAVALARGEEVPDRSDIPIVVVTEENVDDFRAIFEQ